jgi:hypothetical protein
MQPEFNFDNNSQPDGLAAWHHARQSAVLSLAIKLGLPIEHQVEVSLKDGVILRGKLRVGEVVLGLETLTRAKLSLEVDGVVFSCSEIESCVRLD